MWYRGSNGEDEKSCLMMGASTARSIERVRSLDLVSKDCKRLTVTLQPSLVDTRTCHQDIMDNGKNALASNPLAPFVLDLTVFQYGRAIQLDAATVYVTSEGDFVRVEVFPT